MNEQQFKSELDTDAFECSEFSLEPNLQRENHTHPWHARILIQAGELTLTTQEGAHTYRAGDTCALAANVMHSERAGENGVRGLVGKKQP